MKKIGKLLLALMMSLGLCACGGENNDTDKTTFVVGMECAYAP